MRKRAMAPRRTADGDVDHPVVGKRLRRRRDARRGRSAAGGDFRAHVIALVDAQPFLCRVHDSDQLVPVEQLGGLLGAVLVGVLARLETRAGEERGGGTETPRVLVRPRVAAVGVDAADDREPSPGAAAAVHRALPCDGSARFDTAVCVSRGVTRRKPLGGSCRSRRCERESDRSQAGQRHGCRQDQRRLGDVPKGSVSDPRATAMTGGEPTARPSEMPGYQGRGIQAPPCVPPSGSNTGPRRSTFAEPTPLRR